mgnify:CR=1 FL=1
MSQQKKTEIFSKRLRERIARLALQQTEIASHLKVETTAVSNWASGANLPKGKHLRGLADYLNCSVDWLMGRDEASYALKDAPRPPGTDWMRRANEAERKLADLRSGLWRLLEETSAPASSSFAEEELRAVRLAERAVDAEQRSGEAGAPSEKKSLPSPGVLPGSNPPPGSPKPDQE